VKNEVGSAKLIGEIHNHPNKTTPSPKDLLFTSEMCNEKNDYKGTVVYTEGGVLYSIYVRNREKLGSLHEKLKNNIDTLTNDFRKDGCVVEARKNSYNRWHSLSKEEKYIFKLLYVVEENASILKYDEKSNDLKIYSMKKIEENNEIKYKLVKNK
jgi:hypothetical protein